MLELRLQVGVDAKRLHLLVILDFLRALSLLGVLLLSHADERLAGSLVWSGHDVSSWGEHSLHLACLAARELIAALAVHGGAALSSEVVAGCRLLRTSSRLVAKLGVDSTVAAHTLTSRTEEALHIAEVAHILRSLLLVRLRLIGAVKNFLMRAALVPLQALAVVGCKSGLSAALAIRRLHTLHLRLECVIDALALVGRVAEALWTDGLHREVRAQGHALMNLAGRGKRVGPVLLPVAPVRSGVRALVHVILPGLLHRGQLQLVIVEFVRLVSSVSLPVPGEFLIQMNTLGAFWLRLPEGAPFRRHAHVEGLVLVGGPDGLLAGRDHVATHADSGVVGAGLAVSILPRPLVGRVPRVHHFFLTVNTLLPSGFARRLLHAVAV